MADEPNILMSEYIPMDVENVVNIQLNKKDYSVGVRDFSYYAGIITGILNTGISEEYVPEILEVVLDDLKGPMVND